jgi:hypothetical protein
MELPGADRRETAELPFVQPTKFELVINREGARYHNSADTTFPRRRGDRIAMLFAAVRWSLMAHRVISLRCKICPLLV